MSKYRIQRFKQSLTIPNGGTTISSAAEELNGILKGVIADVPALTSTNTVSVVIKDVDGYTVFSKTGIAGNAVAGLFADGNNQPYQLPLSSKHIITVTSSGTEGAARAVKVTLLIDRG